MQWQNSSSGGATKSQSHQLCCVSGEALCLPMHLRWSSLPADASLVKPAAVSGDACCISGQALPHSVSDEAPRRCVSGVALPCCNSGEALRRYVSCEALDLCISSQALLPMCLRWSSPPHVSNEALRRCITGEGLCRCRWSFRLLRLRRSSSPLCLHSMYMLYML